MERITHLVELASIRGRSVEAPCYNCIDTMDLALHNQIVKLNLQITKKQIFNKTEN